MMKQQLVVLLLLLLLHAILLLPVHNVKASRTSKAGKDAARIDEFPQVDHSLETARENTSDMMGTLDRCDDGDGECLERRMMSDVHLDYIYTQHQEP
ncbi:hypothetical protein J5N97_012253 [Dioscorea zingiberensis]|uniref:Phytosulfokine n=1 Tax=Dioscorea zingiberensis TaxID=325984 RepID=A0A9D5CPU6_9LILI|nr:hypothetical protein J5N97_012253 [Dioscorea zingiberensis]